ncbi:hypothetical protein ACOSPZ_004494 [Escherichia coli]
MPIGVIDMILLTMLMALPTPINPIKVSFVNSPPGMRVMETRSSGFDVSHDVGYTRFGR